MTEGFQSVAISEPEIAQKADYFYIVKTGTFSISKAEDLKEGQSPLAAARARKVRSFMRGCRAVEVRVVAIKGKAYSCGLCRLHVLELVAVRTFVGTSRRGVCSCCAAGHSRGRQLPTFRGNPVKFSALSLLLQPLPTCGDLLAEAQRRDLTIVANRLEAALASLLCSTSHREWLDPNSPDSMNS